MKKITYTVFVAFWASVLTLLSVYWLGPAPADGDGAAIHDAHTLEQVGMHAAVDDCWVAIEGNVYDLGNYIPQHPTPPSVIGAWCGRDATEGMRTKNYGRDHSAQAWAQLEKYLIGELAR